MLLRFGYVFHLHRNHSYSKEKHEIHVHCCCSLCVSRGGGCFHCERGVGLLDRLNDYLCIMSSRSPSTRVCSIYPL